MANKQSSKYLIALILFYALNSRAADYTEYHKAINKAEEYIFVTGKIDSGLILYERVFEKYNFVYAGDCVIALQIALFKNDQRRFQKFTIKGFQNGLMLRNFKKIYYVRHHRIFLQDTMFFDNNYELNRRHYLNRIDTNALKDILFLYIDDQMVKNGLNGNQESGKQFNKRYSEILVAFLQRFKNIVLRYGFPGDRIIGLDQKDKMKELKINVPDLLEWFEIKNKTNESFIQRSQFMVDERFLSAGMPFPLIYHLDNFKVSKAVSMFPYSFYLDQIKLGNIHPKDFAVLNDWPYNLIPPTAVLVDSVYYGVGVRTDLSPNSLKIRDEKININRAKIFLPLIEQDRAKWKFMQINKMNYGWGDGGCRS